MAKHQISHNARNLIAYCLRVGKHQGLQEKTRPRILLSNLCPETKSVKVLNAQIQGANDLRKTNRVHHLIFAHPNTDAGAVREVGEAQLIREAIDGLKAKGINLDDTPYVVIAHYDKDNHMDYHLIAASTDLKGKPIKDNYIGSRAMNITNQISKKYGLTLNNDKSQKKKKEQKVERVDTPTITIADEIMLADVETIEVDTSDVYTARAVGITEGIVMGGEKIEQRREQEKKQRERELQEREQRKRKLKEFNDKCDYLGLTMEERENLWTGHDVKHEKGRKVQGMTNDQDVFIRAEDRGERIDFVAIVGDVVKGIKEWLRELAQRIVQKSEYDKRRKQSQKEMHTRERSRGKGFKR